jgi:hypothetical protein
VTLEGEGVVCGPDVVSDFDRLHAALGRKGPKDAFLYAFDVVAGRRRPRPGAFRRAPQGAGQAAAAVGDGIRLSEHLERWSQRFMPPSLRRGTPLMPLGCLMAS